MIPQSVNIELSTEEVLLIQATCDLEPHKDSPLFGLHAELDKAALAALADGLVARGLASAQSYRPDRELVRRLLIVSQPDARLVLLAAGPGQGERLTDVYQRAGAMLPYARKKEQHSLGAPLELVDLMKELKRRFVPRRSTGDFINLELSPSEYFAFSLCGKRMAGHKDVHLDLMPPRKGVADPTLDGAVLIPGQKSRYLFRAHSRLTLPVPAEEEWRAALERLVEKDVLKRSEDRYSLRPYLRDLVLGLATQARYIITRFDYGPSESTVRDATLVPVPGSLFGLSATRAGGVRIRELNAKGLSKVLRQTVLDLEVSKTVDI